MDKLTQGQIDLFLKDLAALTNKHKIEIGGCGCCDSPWVERAEYIGEYHATEDNDGKIEFRKIGGEK